MNGLETCTRLSYSSVHHTATNKTLGIRRRLYHAKIHSENFPSLHPRTRDAISTAAEPQSSPWLCPLFAGRPMPARSRACSSVRAVRTPKMTGTPVSSCTRMSACETLSLMYSKCIVSPLMSTPIAITASKGRFCVLAKPIGLINDATPLPGTGVPERGVPMFCAPSRSMAVAPAWTWDPAITLRG
jgi:hypothetical protein